MRKIIDYERMYWFNIVYILFMFTFIIGITCNFVAVTENKGKMPVYTYYFIESDRHFAYEDNSEVNHPYLTDRINIFNKIFSIGDLIMVFSVTGLIVLNYINVFTKYGSYER